MKFGPARQPSAVVKRACILIFAAIEFATGFGWGIVAPEWCGTIASAYAAPPQWGAPELNVPTEARVYSLRPSISEVENVLRIVFSWRAVESADDYVFTLKRDGLSVLTQKTKKRAVRVKFDKPGFYQWQVSARSKRRGRLPMNSLWRSFEIEGPEGERAERTELVSPTGRLLASDEPVPFVWKHKPGINYSLRVYKKRPDRSIAAVRGGEEDAIYLGEGLPVFLPPGEYQWQVDGKYEESKKTVPSTLRDFRVERFNDRNPWNGQIAVTGGMSFLSLITSNSLVESTLAPQLLGTTVEANLYLPRNLAFDLGFSAATSSELSAPLISGAAGVRHGLPFWGRRFHVGLGAHFGYNRIPQMIPSIDEFDEVSYSTDYTQRWSLQPFIWTSLQADRDVRLFMEGGVLVPISSASSGHSDGVSVSVGTPYHIRGGVEAAWFWPFGLRLDGGLVSDGFRYSIPGDVLQGSLSGFQLRFGLFYSF